MGHEYSPPPGVENVAEKRFSRPRKEREVFLYVDDSAASAAEGRGQNRRSASRDAGEVLLDPRSPTSCSYFVGSTSKYRPRMVSNSLTLILYGLKCIKLALILSLI